MRSIYIGNLSYDITQQQINDLFSQFGNVISSRMILDKVTHKFKGYAFVDMELENAKTAISMLNGVSYQGRIMRVSMANPIEQDSRNQDVKSKDTKNNGADNNIEDNNVENQDLKNKA